MKPIYKILIILAAVALIGLVSVWAWRAFFSTPESQVPSLPEEGGGGELPVAGGDADDTGEKKVVAEDGRELKLSMISDKGRGIFDYWVNSTGGIYYISLNGHVYSAEPGPDPELSTQDVLALNFIDVGPEGEQVLVAFGDPKAPNWGLFDALDKVWRPLPEGILNVTWGKTDNELIGLVKNGGETNLARIDTEEVLAEAQTFKYETLIRNFRLKDVVFKWIPPNRLIVSEKPASFYEARVWQIDLDSLRLNLLSRGERGRIVRFIRDEDLVFQFTPPGTFLILNHELESPIFTTFSTLPSKCGLDSDTIYCFAPQNLTPDIPNFKMPDDYLQGRFYTTDDLYKIKRDPIELSSILESGQGDLPTIDAKSVRVTNDGVYFINRYDGALYELER